jgi:hydroxymethylglutaryl-CoA lyase
LGAGCYEISLGDTLGVGTPADVQRLLEVLLKKLPAKRLAGHYHDTYGQAVANVMKSFELGLRVFDSSIAGLGGCPFARGATGNLATEDIVYMFEKLGVSTGVDLDKLVETGAWISHRLGQQNQSRAGRALYAKKSAAAKSHEALSQQATKYVWKDVKSTEEYCLSRVGPNVKLTLTRPHKGNMLSARMVQELTLVFKELSKDPSVSRIVLTGKGKYFCTGMDLSASASSKAGTFSGLTSLFQAIDAATQTTVALINGPCFGGGVGLALACDIRLAVKSATFTLSEVKLGLSPAVISKYVVRELGTSFSREMMLTGRGVPAEELRGISALHALAEDVGQLDSVLEGYLDGMRGCAPGGAALCKDLVRAAWTGPGSEMQASRIKEVFDTMMEPSPEAKHGMSQFRAGVKMVDWDLFYQDKQRSKL